jgi:hypothetical protein
VKDNLKSCPFCGGEGKLETMLYGGTAVSCQNTDCGFYGYNVETSMWNTRPNDAKAMIYQGLRELSWVDNGDKSLAELIDDELSSVGGSFSSQDMIDALYEVCKQSSEGE